MNLLRYTLISALLAVSGWASPADPKIAEGRAALVAHDLATARTKFTEARALDASNETAAAWRMREAFPCARIDAFALVRTMGLISRVEQLLDPCRGEIRWRRGDAYRSP